MATTRAMRVMRMAATRVLRMSLSTRTLRSMSPMFLCRAMRRSRVTRRTAGRAVTRAALAAVVRPAMIVLDPCTGLGMTARITHALGGCFRGGEMNPKRLARTEEWLRKRERG